MRGQSSTSIRSNIWKLNAIPALTQALFAIPIIVLFWQSHGLNLKQILLLQAGFAATILMLEIPTGYIADRCGRKRTIVVGCGFNFLAYIIYATGSGFWQFFVAEMIVGVGASFLSGSIEAITYDTLLELGEEQKYRRIAGHQAFLEFNTEALCGLLGGMFAAISLALPLWMTIVPMGASIFIALSLHEPKRHRAQTTYHWKSIRKVSMDTLVRHRGLRSIILLHGLISTLTLTFFWFFQPYETLVGFPIWLFGLSHAIIVAAGACASKAVSVLEKKIDDRLLLMGIAVLVIGGFLVLGLPPTLWLLPAFLVSRIAWGALGPLTADIVNRMTTSDVRATVLSLRSFLGRLIFVCTSPFVGALADVHSIPFALTIVGLISTLILMMVFTTMRSVWREIPA